MLCLFLVCVLGWAQRCANTVAIQQVLVSVWALRWCGKVVVGFLLSTSLTLAHVQVQCTVSTGFIVSSIVTRHIL